MAFFADSAAQPREAFWAAKVQLLLLGFAGTALLLVLFERIWRNRFRGVRRRLVHNSRMRGVQ